MPAFRMAGAHDAGSGSSDDAGLVGDAGISADGGPVPEPASGCSCSAPGQRKSPSDPSGLALLSGLGVLLVRVRPRRRSARRLAGRR